jgi:anti-sigma factor RsiW
MSARRQPSPHARCLALLGQLSRYVDDEMTPRERRKIDAHCSDCARCRRMIAGLRRTVALCREAGSTALPARLRRRARTNIARLLRSL